MPKPGSRRSPPRRSAELVALLLAELLLAGLGLAGLGPALPARAQVPRVVADAIPDSLTGRPGDADRGRAIVGNRQVGLCLLCHTGPLPERFQGDLAPDMRGAGSRWSEGQLRLRIVDARRFNPDTIMPSYYRTDGLARVAPAWHGKPVLTAEQIEDVVAFLITLRE